MYKKTSSSGVDMDQLQHNFKQYQYKGPSTNSSQSKSTSSTNEYGDPHGTGYQGGTPNFYGDHTGKDGTFTPQLPSQTSSTPTAASDYKANYQFNLKKYLTTPSSINLKKYLTTPSSTTNNTVSQTNNQIDNRKLSSSTVDNDITQNTGNKEDMKTDIGNDNSISNSNIGNDYSVNIGGISNGGSGGSSSALNNMQGLAAYQALNNNQLQRSKSEINGIKRAQQAIDQGNAATGAYDSVANLYNNVGMQQNYWSSKADAQQNFYLGDIFAMKSPKYKGGGVNPSDPMKGDKTSELYEDFKDSL